MARFRVTYEIVTPESAEYGDAAEHGFMSPGEWKTPIEAALADSESDYTMPLRDALYLCGGAFEDCGCWFLETDSREDYGTGDYETRALHPPENITAASYARLKRLLGAR